MGRLFHQAGCAVLALLPILLHAQTLQDRTSPQGWPRQAQLDISELIAVFDQHFPEDQTGGELTPQAGIQECPLSDQQKWLAAGLSKAQIDTINPAAHFPAGADGLTSKQQSISLKSDGEGCGLLASVTSILPGDVSQRAGSLPDNFDRPVFIEARFQTGTRSRRDRSKSEHTYTFSTIKTGVNSFPTAVKLIRQGHLTGPFYGDLRSSETELQFRGDSGKTPYSMVSLNRAEYLQGRQAMPKSYYLAMNWEDQSNRYHRNWGDYTVISSRNQQRHGINFTGVSMADFNFQFDCFINGEKLDYYRTVNDYDCALAQEEEFGKEGVYRSSALNELALQAEAQERIRQRMAGNTNNSAAAGSGSGTVEECAKAYAASRLCEYIPADPFGIARGICSRKVKNQFGGLGCPLAL